jgi:hypothetical protein
MAAMNTIEVADNHHSRLAHPVRAPLLLGIWNS